MSDAKQETIVEIVESMRRGTKLPGFWRSCDVNKILEFHADRIEMAWNRERGEIEAEALSVGAILEASQHKTVGNAAAMREALELALDALLSWLNGTIDRNKNREAIKAIRAALAAPPRQCDVGTAEEQSERKMKFCYQQGGCSNCSFSKSATLTQCALAWAQTPYAQEGASK